MTTPQLSEATRRRIEELSNGYYLAMNNSVNVTLTTLATELQAGHEETKEALHSSAKLLREYRDRVKAKDDEIARLREALDKYAEHQPDCDSMMGISLRCTCGMCDAMSQQEPKGIQMTPDEIRIAVAECLGWEFPSNLILCSDGRWGFKQGRQESDKVPDYPNDLNACAEFEATLTSQERETYAFWLAHICDFGTYIFATALQRCEAFLRTKDKWK